MLHQLQAKMKGDIQETIESSLNTHLSPIKSIIIAEISQHDNLSRATWIEQLEEIFKRYLGSQMPALTSSPGSPPRCTPTQSRDPSPSLRHTTYTAEMLKSDAAHLHSLLIPVHGINLPLKIDGVTADLEITHRLRLWLASSESELLWIQGIAANSQTSTPSLALDAVAAARAANVPVLWYICRRLDSSGNEISQTELFVDLLISLLHQLTQSTSCSFPNNFGLGASRFSLLNKSPNSILDALALLSDILCRSERSCHRIIVIDGLDLLDYSGDESLEDHVKSLLSILKVP